MFSVKRCVAGFVLAVSLSVFSQSEANAQIVDWSYDGFCDGVSMNFSFSPLVAGNETGCVSGQVIGFEVAPNVVLYVSPQTAPGVVYIVDLNQQVWVNFIDGTLLNRGTLTFGPPPAALDGGPASSD